MPSPDVQTKEYFEANKLDLFQNNLPLYESLLVLYGSPTECFNYAQIRKGPFQLAEATIAQDANVATAYATTVLEAPFPLAEPIIAKVLSAKIVYLQAFPERTAIMTQYD